MKFEHLLLLVAVAVLVMDKRNGTARTVKPCTGDCPDHHDLKVV